MMPAAIVIDWSIGSIAIGIVVIAAVAALVYVALRQFKVDIPEWVRNVFWILICAIVVIAAIRIVLSL